MSNLLVLNAARQLEQLALKFGDPADTTLWKNGKSAVVTADSARVLRALDERDAVWYYTAESPTDIISTSAATTRWIEAAARLTTTVVAHTLGTGAPLNAKLYPSAWKSARTAADPWCGMFAAAVTAGARGTTIDDVFPETPAREWLALAANWIAYGKEVSSAYPGVALVKSADQDHVAIVLASNAGSVLTVEGNSSRTIAWRVRPIAWWQKRGFRMYSVGASLPGDVSNVATDPNRVNQVIPRSVAAVPVVARGGTRGTRPSTVSSQFSSSARSPDPNRLRTDLLLDVALAAAMTIPGIELESSGDDFTTMFDADGAAIMNVRVVSWDSARSHPLFSPVNQSTLAVLGDDIRLTPRSWVPTAPVFWVMPHVSSEYGAISSMNIIMGAVDSLEPIANAPSAFKRPAESVAPWLKETAFPNWRSPTAFKVARIRPTGTIVLETVEALAAFMMMCQDTPQAPGVHVICVGPAATVLEAASSPATVGDDVASLLGLEAGAIHPYVFVFTGPPVEPSDTRRGERGNAPDAILSDLGTRAEIRVDRLIRRFGSMVSVGVIQEDATARIVPQIFSVGNYSYGWALSLSGLPSESDRRGLFHAFSAEFPTDATANCGLSDLSVVQVRVPLSPVVASAARWAKFRVTPQDLGGRTLGQAITGTSSGLQRARYERVFSVKGSS